MKGDDVETLDQKPIPQQLIDLRWKKDKNGLTRCLVHDSYFSEKEEPCWACYYEVQDKEGE